MSWDEGASDLPKDPWPYGPMWEWPEADQKRLRAAMTEAARPLNELLSRVQALEALPPAGQK